LWERVKLAANVIEEMTLRAELISTTLGRARGHANRALGTGRHEPGFPGGLTLQARGQARCLGFIERFNPR
jgi:hypothetical protein